MEHHSVYIAQSTIHGKGVFTSRALINGQRVGPGIKLYLWLPIIEPGLGTMINHSWQPNCHLAWNANNFSWDIVSIKDMTKDTELTLDYRRTPWYIQKPPNTFT